MKRDDLGGTSICRKESSVGKGSRNWEKKVSLRLTRLKNPSWNGRGEGPPGPGGSA